MSDTAVETDLTLAVLSRDYPRANRASETADLPFWDSDNEEDRTFFVRENGDSEHVLVVHANDPRGAGMWETSPPGHRGWSVPNEFLTLKDADGVSVFAVGDRVMVKSDCDVIWALGSVGTVLLSSPANVQVGFDEPIGPHRSFGFFPHSLVKVPVEGGVQSYAAQVAESIVGTDEDAAEALTVDQYRSLREQVRALQESVERLSGERDMAVERAERLREQVNSQEAQTQEAQQMHRADIAYISEVLIEEADNRDWCGEYDDIVHKINRSLSVRMDVRKREWEVTMDVTFRMSRTVTAEDADDAREDALEGIDGSDIESYEQPHRVEVVSTSEM